MNKESMTFGWISLGLILVSFFAFLLIQLVGPFELALAFLLSGIVFSVILGIFGRKTIPGKIGIGISLLIICVGVIQYVHFLKIKDSAEQEMLDAMERDALEHRE